MKKKKRNVERQIVWEVQSEDPPEIHHYNFLVINGLREINRIAQKIRFVFRPTDNFMDWTEGNVRRTKLKYKLFSIDSYLTSPDKIDWSTIYQGKIVRDRRLENRQTPKGLADFVDEAIANGSLP